MLEATSIRLSAGQGKPTIMRRDIARGRPRDLEEMTIGQSPARTQRLPSGTRHNRIPAAHCRDRRTACLKDASAALARSRYAGP